MSIFIGTIILPLIPIFLILYKISPRIFHTSEFPLPPSPPGDFLIGHFRKVPASRPELMYQKWGKDYKSDIISINLLSIPAIIINSLEAAIALLEKRGTKYSDRPNMAFYAEEGWHDTVTYMSRGPAFRRHRKMFQNAFSKANILQYRDAQVKGARKLVGRIVDDGSGVGERWRDWLVMYSTTFILDIAYGITGDGTNDHLFVDVAHKATNAIGNSGPSGATAVDIFPWIRKLPHWFTWIPSLKFARDCYPDVRAMHDFPFEAVKNEMEGGIMKNSFVHKMLAEIRSNPKSVGQSMGKITEADIKGVAGTIYSAGQDTTSSTMIAFVLAMVLHKEAQERAWKELDEVVGRGRFPDFEDRERLKYVECVVQETYRWLPVVPQGLPHRSSEDDIYNGMFIPKGKSPFYNHPSVFFVSHKLKTSTEIKLSKLTLINIPTGLGSTIIPNTYAMGHDPSIYHSPDLFSPSRYLSVEEGGNDEPYPIAQWGFGRRICPGQHLADASVWILIATMLHKLRFEKKKDAQGREIIPDPVISTGLTSHAEEFPCVILSR